jgi:hypothetical protein
MKTINLIEHEIAMVKEWNQRIEVFEKQCEESEHTDVQALWDFVYEAKALSNKIENQLKKQINPPYRYETRSIILSREDIDSIGYDSSTLTNEEFERIGAKAGEYIMENWWDSLEELCKDMKPLEDSVPL